MYTTYHIFPVLPIKDLINKDGNPNIPFQLTTGTDPSASHLRVSFCPCIVRKATAHVGKKALTMRHQEQKGCRGIFIGIPHDQKLYIVYIPCTRKIKSSYDVVFYESFSSALEYTSQPHSEVMVMRPSVTYTTCNTYSRGEIGDIITFAQFEEGDLLSENRNDAESGDEPDDN